jgi:16S rRNA (uracil1498-N3)-methyltransferase
MVGGVAGATGAVPEPVPTGPDPVLVSAKAMVFVDDPAAPVLSRADARHLLDVLRLRPGEVVVAGDGAGSWVPCRVSAATGAAGSSDPGTVLVPDGGVTAGPRPQPEITVAFVPAKGDRPDWVVQKLTELGVDRIVPLRSHRSVVRWEGDRADRAVERLRRIAREASAQCRRAWLPEVTGVTTVEAMASQPGGRPTLAHPGGERPSLSHPVIAIGPEGGWDEDELAGARGTVGLGPTVLRAETAAVSAGTILCALRGGVVVTLAQPRSVSKTTT